LALAEMHLGRRGEDHRVGALDAFRQFAGVVRDAVLLGDLGCGVLVAADQRADFDAGNALERIEMLLAKGALAGNADLHHLLLIMSVFCRAAARLGFALPAAFFLRFSRMIWPTAVFDAGTV